MSRFTALLLASAFLLKSPGQAPDGQEAEISTLLSRLYEACRAHEARTKTFPRDIRELSAELSNSLRARMPTGIEFKSATEMDLFRNSAFGERTPCLRLKVDAAGGERWLNVAFSGSVYASSRYWESEFVDLLPRPYADPRFLKRDARPLPQRVTARSANCTAQQIDLQKWCNALPTDPWFFGLAEPVRDLGPFKEDIRTGWSTFGGIPFDCRAVIQLEGLLTPGVKDSRELHSYPPTVKGIRITASGKQIHLLAGVCGSASPGSTVATLNLRDSSRTISLELKYGVHVIAPSSLKLNTAMPPNVHLLHPKPENPDGIYGITLITLPNPFPSDLLEFDFAAGETTAHPFLMGMTISE